LFVAIIEVFVPGGGHRVLPRFGMRLVCRCDVTYLEDLKENLTASAKDTAEVPCGRLARRELQR
jgi:hypothetical protein